MVHVHVWSCASHVHGCVGVVMCRDVVWSMCMYGHVLVTCMDVLVWSGHRNHSAVDVVCHLWE